MQPYYEHNGITFYAGHVLDVWPALAAQGVRVQTVVTSIPYYGLRSYGTEPQTWPDGWVGELGQEDAPDRFVAHIVAVFRAVRQALRPDGTLWLNVGDTYTANRPYQVPDNKHRDVGNSRAMKLPPGMSEKQLLLMPARVALALQADGWILRNELIWHKTAPMPESVRDRFTRAHEQIFVFSQRPRYFMDMAAIAEPTTQPTGTPMQAGQQKWTQEGGRASSLLGSNQGAATRNPRDVLTLGPDPYADAHFATFPREIPRRAILAGSRPGDLVADPFLGSGTSAEVAYLLQRGFVGGDLKAEYLQLAIARMQAATPWYARADTAAPVHELGPLFANIA